jgi:Leucine-rich repeat (LRR) protein
MANAPPVVLDAEGPPLDYSFKELRSCTELAQEQPRNARKTEKKERPQKENDAKGKHAGPTAGIVDDRAKTEKKMVVTLQTNSIRLNNNFLTTLKEFPQALSDVLSQPMKLVFLDLSWNQLEKIEPVLLQYEQLKALYLHGNRIAKLPQVDKLKGLPQIRSLTLNGNPIECNSCYRLYVVGMLQHSTDLRSLDHSTVTDDERERAEAWSFGHENRIAERKRLKEEMTSYE